MSKSPLFGVWLKLRRKALDLTQEALAQQVNCSVVSIRKFESDIQRPSRQMAGLLAQHLAIPPKERAVFVQFARGGLDGALPTTQTTTIVTPQPLQAIWGSPLIDPTSLSGDEYGSALSIQRHNLPTQLTAFIGREVELMKLTNLLADPDCRLVTIVGAGGSGKTRLALQSALGHITSYPHGVFFVALASINSLDFLIPAIAASLDFSFNGLLAPNIQLLNYLREKALLLVLDNFEHLVGGERFLTDILTSASEVKLLVTSRKRLNVYGEWVYQIQGLALPELSGAEHLEEWSAALLFLQSARQVQSNFLPSEEEKQAIVRLCQIVEGMPLELELAASWVRVLSCEEIVKELTRSLSFLVTSSQTIPERHRSIRAVFDHSWHLLSSEEQRVFRSLSVFQGRFRREAAEHIVSTSLPLLAALLDKSLLSRRPDGRYELHELIRQYAAEKLAETPSEKDMMQDHHGRYYLGLLRQQETWLKSSQQQQAVEVIREEIDNIRVACQRAITQGWAKELGQATQSLWLFYDIQGWYHEAEAFFKQAAEALASQPGAQNGGSTPTSDVVQGRQGMEQRRERGIALGLVLSQQAWFLFHLGLIGKARELFQYSEVLLRRLDARTELAENFQAASMAIWAAGDYEKAQAILQEALAIFVEQGSQWGAAVCFMCWGNVTAMLGDYGKAKQLLQKALAISKVTGDPKLTALVLNHIGPIAHKLGDYTQAKRWLQQSIILSRKIGDRWSMIVCLNHLGSMIYQQGPAEWPEARRLHEESLTISKELGERREIAVSLNYLGYVTCALAEYDRAKEHFLVALKTAIEGQMTPIALDSLVGLATLLTAHPRAGSEPDPAMTKQQAIKLLGVVLNHSATSREVRDKSQHLLAMLEVELPSPIIEPILAQSQTWSIKDAMTELFIVSEEFSLD